jgi:hypothetical protein
MLQTLSRGLDASGWQLPRASLPTFLEEVALPGANGSAAFALRLAAPHATSSAALLPPLVSVIRHAPHAAPPAPCMEVFCGLSTRRESKQVSSTDERRF